MAHPTIGEKVRVWPHPGTKVRSHDPAEVLRFFPEDGSPLDLPWSLWLEQLYHDGLVHLTDPKPQITADEAAKLADAEKLAEAQHAAGPSENPTLDPVTIKKVGQMLEVVGPTKQEA